MPGSLTNGFLWSRWRGKRSRHSRCMRSQFSVPSKRFMERWNRDSLQMFTTMVCCRVFLIPFVFSFCCGQPFPRKDDKVKLQYKVENEKSHHNSRPKDKHHNSRSGTNTYQKRHVATVDNSVYNSRPHDDVTIRTDTSNKSSPRHHRRHHKNRRIKRIKRPHSLSGLDSSCSSADYPDHRQKPFTLRVEEPGFTMRQPQPYTYIDSHGTRFNVVPDNNPDIRHPIGRSACVYSTTSSNADSRTVSRTSSKHGDQTMTTITQNGYVRAPNLRVHNGGIEFVNTALPREKHTVDGPIVLRWSPSMRNKAKRYYRGTNTQSAPVSAPSSRADTVDTPASSRVSYQQSRQHLEQSITFPMIFSLICSH